MIATGRTTRMLDDAMEQARNGHAVYVIAASQRHKQILEHMGGEEAHKLGIKFETTHSMGNFNWQTMRLSGAHPNCVVIADHYTIESEFAAMLNMLHRYDPNVTDDNRLAGSEAIRQQTELSNDFARRITRLGASLHTTTERHIQCVEDLVEAYRVLALVLSACNRWVPEHCSDDDSMVIACAEGMVKAANHMGYLEGAKLPIANLRSSWSDVQGGDTDAAAATNQGRRWQDGGDTPPPVEYAPH